VTAQQPVAVGIERFTHVFPPKRDSPLSNKARYSKSRCCSIGVVQGATFARATDSRRRTVRSRWLPSKRDRTGS
jgi:hypothetical protein